MHTYQFLSQSLQTWIHAYELRGAKNGSITLEIDQYQQLINELLLFWGRLDFLPESILGNKKRTWSTSHVQERARLQLCARALSLSLSLCSSSGKYPCLKSYTKKADKLQDWVTVAVLSFSRQVCNPHGSCPASPPTYTLSSRAAKAKNGAHSSPSLNYAPNSTGLEKFTEIWSA